MRVFTGNNTIWCNKVNFVDENNVVLGFNMSATCCEVYGWFISSLAEVATAADESKPSDDELVPYVFDTSFKVDNLKASNDEGGSATFKLVADGKSDLYVTIYNHHNGYYSHGFSFKAGDVVVIEDLL